LHLIHSPRSLTPDIILHAIAIDKNVTNFTERKNSDTLKDGLLLVEEYATSQLHKRK